MAQRRTTRRTREIAIDPIDRFFSYVIPEPNSGCWLWLGALNSAGYVDFWFNGKKVLGHRFSYEVVRGPIKGALSLDHLCRTPSCVNPDHLEPVTLAENTRRGWLHRPARKTHCPKGHTYAGDNLYVNPGTRGMVCRTCFRSYRRLWDAQKRAKNNRKDHRQDKVDKSQE